MPVPSSASETQFHRIMGVGVPPEDSTTTNRALLELHALWVLRFGVELEADAQIVHLKPLSEGEVDIIWPANKLISREGIVIRPTTSASKHDAVLEEFRSKLSSRGIVINACEHSAPAMASASTVTFKTAGSGRSVFSNMKPIHSKPSHVEQASLDKKIWSAQPKQSLKENNTLRTILAEKPVIKLKIAKFTETQAQALKAKQDAKDAAKQAKLAAKHNGPTKAKKNASGEPSKIPEVATIAAGHLTLEHLQTKTLATLKAHLKSLKGQDGKPLKLSGRKDDLIIRILTHHGVCSQVSQPAAKEFTAPPPSTAASDTASGSVHMLNYFGSLLCNSLHPYYRQYSSKAKCRGLDHRDASGQETMY